MEQREREQLAKVGEEKRVREQKQKEQDMKKWLEMQLQEKQERDRLGKY